MAILFKESACYKHLCFLHFKKTISNALRNRPEIVFYVNGLKTNKTMRCFFKIYRLLARNFFAE